MRHERPPVDEQGRSPSYQLGISPPPAPISDRAAVLVWAALTLLVAAYVTLMTVRLAQPAFSLPFVSFVWIPSALVGDRLRTRARLRSYPSTTLKALTVLAVTAAIAWFFVLVFDAGLRTTQPLPLTAYAILTFAITMGAIVLAYRSRFFFWWRTA